MKTTIQPLLKLILSAAILLSVLSARAQSAKEQIAAANREFEEAYAKGDARTIANQYAIDAELLTERGIVKGRANIEKAYTDYIGSPGATARVRTMEIHVNGDSATEVGHIEVVKDGKTTHNAVYLLVWKNLDGKWKVFRDAAVEQTGKH